MKRVSAIHCHPTALGLLLCEVGRMPGRGVVGVTAENTSEGASTANSSSRPHLLPPGHLDRLGIRRLNTQKPHPGRPAAGGAWGCDPFSWAQQVSVLQSLGGGACARQ